MMCSAFPFRTDCMDDIFCFQIICSGNSYLTSGNFANLPAFLQYLLNSCCFIDSQISATCTDWMRICCIYNGICLYFCNIIRIILNGTMAPPFCTFYMLLLILIVRISRFIFLYICIFNIYYDIFFFIIIRITQVCIF